MTSGWWFEVGPVPAEGPVRRRSARWLVGIENETRARLRLAEEVRADALIVRLRQASASELEQHRIGPRHPRQVEAPLP